MKQPSERKWFYGYQIVAASSIIQMLYLSLMFSFGVLFKEFESEFGWSRASIAGASSVMMLMMGTLGIFLGKANDLFGPRLMTETLLFWSGTGEKDVETRCRSYQLLLRKFWISV